MNLLAGVLIVVGAAGCIKPVAMASNKNKLYLYKSDKLYMCDTNEAGKLLCVVATVCYEGSSTPCAGFEDPATPMSPPAEPPNVPQPAPPRGDG